MVEHEYNIAHTTSPRPPHGGLPLPLQRGGEKQKMSKIHNNKIFISRRRDLRKSATPTEKKLWQVLRKKIMGVKFKRQHSIGGYITDFYCANKKLIIELDGAVHNSEESREYDEIRDKFFKELGYSTLRFRNSEIENNFEEVINEIENFCNKKSIS